MKLLLLGGNFPKSDEKDINDNSKNAVQNAANIFQWNLIKGFKEILKDDFYVLSAPFISPYPNGYKKATYNGKIINCNEEYISFLNLFGIRNISRYNNLRKSSKRFLKLKDKEKYVIVYSPHVPLLKTANYLKRKDNSITIVLLLPDLPEYVALTKKKSLIYKLLKPIDIKSFYHYSSIFDKYIFLTKDMNEIINKFQKPYLVVEGIVDVNQSGNKSKIISCKESKIISYTGTLNEKYGIKNLIDAFLKLDDDNCKLIICGHGDCEDYIKKCSIKDTRIIFEGQISASKAKDIQMNSDLLINPRQNIEEFTKYSFPSKNLEYLSTGNPVIAYKLDGIPDEYDKILFYPQNNSIIELRNQIKKCLNLKAEEIFNYKKSVHDFLKEKNIYNTSKKILNFILKEVGEISDKNNK